MTQPLIITSNRHGYAVAIYTFEMILGGFILLGFIPPVSQVSTLVGDHIARGWALILFLAAAACIASMFPEDPAFTRRIEAWGNVAIAASMGFLMLAVFSVGRVTPVGIALMGGLTVAAIWRSVQTFREVKEVKRANAAPIMITEEYLAAPELGNKTE